MRGKSKEAYYKNMFKKKKTYIILIIIVLIIGVVFYFKNKKPKVEYTTAKAEKGTLSQTVSATGKLVAPYQVDLSFKISGRIQKLYVDVGDRVKKGQIIATIDKGVLLDELHQAQKEVTAQKQTLANMKRKASTYKIEQENAQRAEVQKAEAAVSEIYTNLRETTIYAPLDGIVIRKNVDVGETTVANAVTENTSVVTIAQEGNLEIETNVPESDITKVTESQNADITLDAFTAQDIFPAKVTKIEPASTIIQDVVYYKVKLNFNSDDSRFRNGMSANIDIKTASKNNVVFIPERAVKDDNGQKFVEILKDEKTNTIERANVKTGMKGDDGMIEITSGLMGGEKVVTFTKTQ